ncbi:MAG: fumarylacetoacetate hydrolase family protein [Actinomycetia bacterium]|nr:fumarylacetoacetate hydrolase family protein [Actinomycetes bacterium]
MTFRFANIDGRAALVDAHDHWYDLERLTSGAVGSDPMAALADGAALHRAADGLAAATPDGALAGAALDAPVPAPRNSFGVGLNYRSHATESNMDLPEKPLVFSKFPSCIVGPTADVELNSKTGDWEVELVVVIGEGGRDIPAGKAWDHVLGLMVGQDISDRALQFAAKPPHFDLGKSRDTYGPIGPVLVSIDSFADPADLAITCDINGHRKQDDRTSSLIFTVPELIAYLSGILTLGPGDLIFTGTPEGVGAASRTFLNPGDEIVSTIEGIGTMTNRCV